MKYLQIVFFVFSLFALNAHAANQGIAEHPFKLAVDVPDIAAINVVDKRPYVLNGEKPASYSGQAIGWKGPRDDGLNTGEPMTEYLYRKLLTLNNNVLVKNGGTLKLTINELQVRNYVVVSAKNSKLVSDIELSWYKKGKLVYSKQYVDKLQTDYSVPTIREGIGRFHIVYDAIFSHYIGIMLNDFFTQVNQGAKGSIQSKSPCSAAEMKKLVAKGFSIDDALDICAKQ